ncbi:sigma-54 dependent transcriptional regulator [Ignavibacteriales bacterium]
MQNRILVIDDDRAYLIAMKRLLEGTSFGFEVETACSSLDALDKLESHSYDCMLLDVRIPGLNGIEFLKIVISKYASIPVIMVSAQNSIELAVECIKQGAFDYIEKPVEPTRLTVSIRNALRTRTLISENKVFLDEIKDKYRMVGSSARMIEIKNLIYKTAMTDVTVLIQGESGTGKELVAKSIHYNSKRRTKKIIVMNCASLSKDLLESELFGHTRGAFTGADETRIGKIQAAHQGTLFLDEIGDMNFELQGKLLRVLEERKITKIGANIEEEVDVRVIAATNKSLSKMVEEKTFREDLFYRLNVFPITIPPLRERRGDIPELLKHFLIKSSQKYNKSLVEMSDYVIKFLSEQEWHGNVRELKNFVDRLCILTTNKVISLEEVSLLLNLKDQRFTNFVPAEVVSNLKFHKAELEKEYLLEVLNRVDFNINKAAEELGIDRSNLYKRLKKLGISPVH